MSSFLKKVIEKNNAESAKRYFLRFGKGVYNQRFLISYTKGKNIKVRGSFEWANDFVRFVKENKDLRFFGRVMSLEKIQGMNGKKKGASFVYDVEESSLEEFQNPYFYLVNVNSNDIVLKIKKALPKPGKEADKIDDKFCALDIDVKYWPKFKEYFFWDVPEGKKVQIEHTLEVTEVEIPKDVPTEEVREKSVRKGKIVRKITVDGKETVKEYDLVI